MEQSRPLLRVKRVLAAAALLPSPPANMYGQDPYRSSPIRTPPPHPRPIPQEPYPPAPGQYPGASSRTSRRRRNA